MTLKRSKEWWLDQARKEPDVPIAAGRCDHEDFEATVKVGRLANAEGKIANYTADVRIHCRQCGRAFQFLGLEPGVDLQGARMSIDGLEAHLGICPQGEQPSLLDNISVNFRGPGLTQ